MPTPRSFPRALAASCAAACLALSAAPAAHAALNPAWLDTATLADSGAEAFWPRAASSHGRTVVVWKESDGSTMRLFASVRGTDGTWGTPEPISTAGQELNHENYRVAADADGDITAIWREDGGNYPVYSRTLAAGDTDWAEKQLLAESDGGSNIELSSLNDGSLVASYTSYHGADTVRLRTMRPGSITWEGLDDIDQSGSAPSGLAVAFNASGDGVATWAAHPDSNYLVRASRYTAATDSWSAPVDVSTPSTTSVEGTYVALAPSGAATVVWGSGTDSTGRNASADAGSDTWVTQDPLLADSPAAVIGGLASDRDGNIVAAYQTWDGSDMSTSRAVTRTRTAADGRWSGQEMLMSDQFGGGITLTADRNYNILASMLTSSDPSTVNVAAVYRPDGASSFTDDDFVGTHAMEFSHGIPISALDDRGNPIVVWPQHGSGEVRVNAAIGDATGPDLSSLSVPTSGTVGEPVTFSVSPFDFLSGMDTTSWSFGDSRDATGTNISHTYEAPGTYAVTVSSRDLRGQTSSETRTITITSPPAAPVDEPDDAAPAPPKVLAPVLEARLSGKTITLNTRVTLRAGKKCTGRATATTRFGTTTYRTTLKLAKVNGKCVGTGTIKLKKTPSTRTKLRVTVSAKNIKTRTLTTKRA